MSNPTNLQELAASLAAVANAPLSEQAQLQADIGPSVGAYRNGYRDALLDTRATVLAMIQDVNRRIANNNQVVSASGPVSRASGYHQGNLDGRIEAYEDVRGGDEAPDMSPLVLRPILWQDSEGHLFDAWGGDYLPTQPEEAITAVRHGLTRERLHKAAPDDNAESYSMCATCGKPIKHLPAGQGWVHEDTGMVVG